MTTKEEMTAICLRFGERAGWEREDNRSWPKAWADDGFLLAMATRNQQKVGRIALESISSKFKASIQQLARRRLFPASSGLFWCFIAHAAMLLALRGCGAEGALDTGDVFQSGSV